MSRTPQAAPSAPTARDPIELQLAVAALKAVAVLAVPVVGIAWLAAGTSGAIGAGIAVAVVAGMYLMSGALLSFAARLGPGALMGAALGGFALRLMIYALLVVLLSPVEAIHGESLAISAAVLLVLTLVWEARTAATTSHLFWVDAGAARPRPAPLHPAAPLRPAGSLPAASPQATDVAAQRRNPA